MPKRGLGAKVALFGLAGAYTQLANGQWTSKLGNEHDIEHDAPDTVAGVAPGELMS